MGYPQEPPLHRLHQSETNHIVEPNIPPPPPSSSSDNILPKKESVSLSFSNPNYNNVVTRSRPLSQHQQQSNGGGVPITRRIRSRGLNHISHNIVQSEPNILIDADFKE